MNYEKAFHALQVLAQTPATRAWLEVNDPQALAQALSALAPAAGDAVTVKTMILTEMMDNLATLVGPKSFVVEASTVNDRGLVNCMMCDESEAEGVMRATVLAEFVRTFVHPDARVDAGGGYGVDVLVHRERKTSKFVGVSVMIAIDENTA